MEASSTPPIAGVAPISFTQEIRKNLKNCFHLSQVLNVKCNLIKHSEIPGILCMVLSPTGKVHEHRGLASNIGNDIETIYGSNSVVWLKSHTVGKRQFCGEPDALRAVVSTSAMLEASGDSSNTDVWFAFWEMQIWLLWNVASDLRLLKTFQMFLMLVKTENSSSERDLRVILSETFDTLSSKAVYRAVFMCLFVCLLTLCLRHRLTIVAQVGLKLAVLPCSLQVLWLWTCGTRHDYCVLCKCLHMSSSFSRYEALYSPIHVGLSICLAIFKVLIRQSWCWDVLGTATLSHIEDIDLCLCLWSVKGYFMTMWNWKESIFIACQ